MEKATKIREPKRVISTVMVLMMIFSSLFINLPLSYAADSQTTYVYDFHKLGVDDQGTQDGWNLKAKYDDSLALGAQSFGLEIDCDASSGWITFNMDIPVTGWYSVGLRGALAGAGGITDIILDGDTLGQYDFYSADFVADGGLKSLKVINLTAGVHELKLQATGTNSGGWSYRMYVSELVLTTSEPAPAVLDFDFHKLGVDGQETQLGWSIKEKYSDSLGLSAQSYGLQIENDASDGWITFNMNVPAGGWYEVRFSGGLAGGGGITDVLVDGTNVGQYNFYNASLIDGALQTMKVINLTEGTHELKLQATGYADGWSYRMYPSLLELAPTEPASTEYNYDFHKLGVDDQGTQAYWSIAEKSITHDIYAASYGLQVENYDINKWMSFSFSVGQDGIYQAGLSSALAAGGALTDIIIDGKKIGQYDFYGADYVAATDVATIKTLELAKGSHILTIKAVDHTYPSWGYCMYPRMFVLKKVDALPNLTDLVMRANSDTLVRGQSTWIILKGKLDDGTLDGLEDTEAKTFASDNETVATVDSDGIIKAGSPGTANITVHVSLRGVVLEKTITIIVISDVLDVVKLLPEKTDLIEGGSCGVSVSALLTNGKPALLNDAEIVISSEDESIVSASTVAIYANTPGETYLNLKLTLGEVTKTDRVKITVEKLVLSSVELYTADGINDILMGKTKQLSVKGTLNNGNAVDLTADGVTIAYESRNADIATVDSITGVVTANKEGTAEINANVSVNGITMSDIITVTVFTWEHANNKKTKSSLYTTEKIANARNNIAKYDWAKVEKDKAVAKADEYLTLGKDFWWSTVTSQKLPRSYSVNQSMKCPVCGDDIYSDYGNYPWVIDPVNHPFKLICPKTGEIFPSNDFESYYKGGLDENGNFDPVKAKQHNDELIANGGTGNLVNVLYPDKASNWCVDDGYGAYADDPSQKLLFIAYYNHWGLWYNDHGYGIIQTALDSFRDAYLYTGNVKYAQMGTILLDRIADVYPDMYSSVFKKDDGFLNSNGGTGLGKILGSIWETLLVPSFIRAYDAFFPTMDDQEVISYLKSKAELYNLENPKISVSAIRKNIEDGILRQVLPGVKNCQLEGNTGMQQSCIALAAVVFDSLPETKELIDFNNAACELYDSPRRVTGGGLLPILINDVDRDGQGNECAPGYNYLWLQQLRQVADVMDGYTLEGFDSTVDLYKNPKFIKMFKAFYPLVLSSRYTAAIGDTGGTGTASITGTLEDSVKGFEKTGDRVLAQLAYCFNHNKSSGIHSDIFAANPEKVSSDIQAVIDQYGELQLDSTNMTGFGFAALRDGKNYIKEAGIVYDFNTMKLLKNSADYGYYSSSGTWQFDAMVDGLEAEFSFDVANADNYEIDLKTYKAASYGIYDIYIDGQKLKTYDFYGTTGAGNFEDIGELQLASGTHTITFKGNGRNSANTEAYKMGIIQLSLLDAQAQEIKRISVEKGDTQRDVWMYYGSNGGHGHAGTMNLGMHDFGIDVAPELGYPEFADNNPKRYEWESNTISHNTVVVDNSKQNGMNGGTPLHFDDSESVKLMDVDASKAYPQTDMYRRTTALIKVDDKNSYTIDLFRIAGGTNHNFSFHSNEGTVTTEGLELVPQTTGTYAGPDIEYAQRYDSTKDNYTGSGYHYLKNVEKDSSPSGHFSVDWKIDPSRSPLPFEQDVHLKLTMLTQADDVALADGVPPQRPGNPETLRYLIVHRKGANLNSLFTSVLQPYKDSPFIDSISNVSIREGDTEITDGSATAIKVVLKNGRTDYIVNALDNAKTYSVDGKFQFKGFFGVYSEKDGQQVYGYVNDGAFIGKAAATTDAIRGSVTDFTRDLSSSNEITISMNTTNTDLNVLAGRYIYIGNDGFRNAAYKIIAARRIDNTHVAIDIGDTTLIRKFLNDNDFAKEYVYDISTGAEYNIPLSQEIKAQLTYVKLAADATQLTRMKTANLTLKGSLSLEDEADMSKATIQYFSSNTNVAVVENGVVTAYNAGSADIYAKVTLDGVTVQTNTLIINVSVTVDSLKYLVSFYEKSGDIKKTYAKELNRGLDEVGRLMQKGSNRNALNHLQEIIKQLDKESKHKQISAAAKAILVTDVNSLLDQIKLMIEAEKLSAVILSADKTELTKGKTTKLITKGKSASGLDLDLKEAKIEYFSTNHKVATVKDNTVKACNPGNTDVYVKVTLYGITIKSNTITIKVIKKA
jgi:Bacterial Ig-like domain (group 2)./Heparinase II/III-like protein.